MKTRSRQLKNSLSKLPRWQAYGLLLINVICWGASLPIVKPALSYTTPFRYLLYRFVIASVVMTPVIWYYFRRHEITFKRVRIIVLLELIGTVLGLAVLYIGLSRTSSLEASLISTTSPIFTVLAGVIYLHEREERHEWLGLLLAFAGTLMITVTPVLLGKTAFSYFSLSGNALIVLQNIISAVYLVLAKKQYQKIPKLVSSGISFYVGGVAFCFLALSQLGFQGTQFIQAISQDLTHPSVWFASLYMGFFGSVIGATAYMKGQDSIEASEACLFGYLSPLVFFPLSILVLHENFSIFDAVGLVMIAVGVLIAEIRIRRFFRRRSAAKVFSS